MPALSSWALAPVAALLLGCAAGAQPSLPDPVAPAVVGRPLDQLTPARTVRPKSVPAKPVTAKAAPANSVAASSVAAKPPTVSVAATATPAPAAPVAVAQPAATPPAAAQPQQRQAKQAVDDRPDAQQGQLAEVGKGTHFARKPLAEGAYFGERHRVAARKYYEANPVMRPAVKWKIGEPVPRNAVVALVPRPLLAALPPVPPGHQYVELGGEVVLVAAGSRMVVDGISRPRNETALLSGTR